MAEPAVTEWASLIVIVSKKYENLHFCVDYRRLNAVTVQCRYPFPRMDEYSDFLSEAQMFSTLNAILYIGRSIWTTKILTILWLSHIMGYKSILGCRLGSKRPLQRSSERWKLYWLGLNGNVPSYISTTLPFSQILRNSTCNTWKTYCVYYAMQAWRSKWRGVSFLAKQLTSLGTWTPLEHYQWLRRAQKQSSWYNSGQPYQGYGRFWDYFTCTKGSSQNF